MHILRLNEMKTTSNDYSVVFKYRDKGGETFYSFSVVSSNYKLKDDHEGFAVKHLEKQEAEDVKLFMSAMEFADHPVKNKLTNNIPVGSGWGVSKKDSLFLLYLLVSKKDGPGMLRELSKNVRPLVYLDFSYKVKNGVKDFYKTHKVEYTDIRISVNCEYGSAYTISLPNYSFDFSWDTFYVW